MLEITHTNSFLLKFEFCDVVTALKRNLKSFKFCQYCQELLQKREAMLKVSKGMYLIRFKGCRCNRVSIRLLYIGGKLKL